MQQASKALCGERRDHAAPQNPQCRATACGGGGVGEVGPEKGRAVARVKVAVKHLSIRPASALDGRFRCDSG